MIYCQLQQSSCFCLTHKKSIKLAPVGDQLPIHGSKPFSCMVVCEENDPCLNLWKGGRVIFSNWVKILSVVMVT